MAAGRVGPVHIIKESLLNIGKCLVAFYGGYYVTLSLGHGAFRSSLPFDGAGPFNISKWIPVCCAVDLITDGDFPKCCIYGTQEKVNLIGLVGAYAVLGLVMMTLVKSRLWDYASTIAVFHVILCMIVTRQSLSNWLWWISQGVSLFTSIALSEIILFCLNESKGKISSTSPI